MAVSMEIINNTGDEAQSIVQRHQMATSVKIGQVEYNVTDPEIQKKLKKEAFDAFKLAKSNKFKIINFNRYLSFICFWVTNSFR